MGESYGAAVRAPLRGKPIMMKTAIVVVAGLLLLPGLADASNKGVKGGATLVPAADVKWSDVPGNDGVQMAVLGGAPDKGASHFLIKLSPGKTVPLHFHNPDHYAYVVAGTMTFDADGKEVSLPPGSYFSFIGKKKHTTRCDAGAECVIFMDARGKWDVVPVGTAK
jgi:quercetin dioxygenase-like cupin family protein